MPKLTVGMPAYSDTQGVWWTIQAMRLYQGDLSEVEFLVVDNNPSSPTAKQLQVTLEHWLPFSNAGARYIPFGSVTGTAAAKNAVFENARGEYVLCIDSHVMLKPGALHKLIKWYEDHPDSKDLLTGPLVYDNLTGISTHFNNVWRGEMWGIWGTAWEACPGGDHFAVLDTGKQATYVTLDMEHTPLTSSATCGLSFPDIKWPGHEKHLQELGCRMLGYREEDEFEIPGNGCGLMSCRKDAWVGFNKDFRGFGGEEMYLQEKFRQAGRRTISLGFLMWLHRFMRTEPHKYPLRVWDKVRNYVIGLRELGLPLDPLHELFVAKGIMPEHEYEYILQDPVSAIDPPNINSKSQKTGSVPVNPEGIFNAVSQIKRDLDQHMPKLAELASKCEHVCELSHRRESLIAFCKGKPMGLTSFNIEAKDPMAVAMVEHAENCSVRADVSPPELPDLPTCDMLFIDWRHTHKTILAALQKYSPTVKRYIVMHDTEVHKERGEDGGLGIGYAVRDFLKENHTWFVAEHSKSQYGLTILGCQEQDKPEQKIITWPHGPGSQLKGVLARLGIAPKVACDCNAKARRMDELGVAGCREHFDEVVGWLRAGQDRWGWRDKLKAATNAVTTGIAFKLNPLDPFPGLVEEAIRLAEDEQA